jgi:flagellar protein FlaF
VQANQLNAYKTADKSGLSGRELEASVLLQGAVKLKDCKDNWHKQDRDEKLDAALKYNQLLWSIFQGELGKEDNPLPRQLKIDLLRLSGFVDKRIFDIMAFPAPEKLDILININRNIAAGLKSGTA